jgi:MoxR-like ATPase
VPTSMVSWLSDYFVESGMLPRALPDLFFVIATQNPVESRGTYPLPEAQMDRFALQFSLGYLAPEDEVNLLSAQLQQHPIQTLKPCASLEDIQGLRTAVQRVRVSAELLRYLVDIVNATRSFPGIQIGASPRASLSFMKIAQALAFFDGYDFVTPDHVQEIAIPVLAHRLALDPQARFAGETTEGTVHQILKTIAVPH